MPETEQSGVKPGVRNALTQLPSWFLANCVQTHENLSSLPIPLVVKSAKHSESPQDTGDAGETGEIGPYQVDELIYRGLQDVLNTCTPSAPVVDGSSSTSFPGFSNDAALLRTLLPSRSAGQEFLRTVAQHFARSQGADMITICKQDMERLCNHLAIERGLSEGISERPLCSFFCKNQDNDDGSDSSSSTSSNSKATSVASSHHTGSDKKKTLETPEAEHDGTDEATNHDAAAEDQQKGTVGEQAQDDQEIKVATVEDEKKGTVEEQVQDGQEITVETTKDGKNGTVEEQVQNEQEIEVEGIREETTVKAEETEAKDEEAEKPEEAEDPTEAKHDEQTEQVGSEEPEPEEDPAIFPFAALLSAAGSQVTMLDGTAEDQKQPRPLIVLIPDVHHFLSPDHGRDMMLQLRDAVKDANSNGTQVIILGLDAWRPSSRSWDYGSRPSKPLLTLSGDHNTLSTLGFNPFTPVIPILPVLAESRTLRLDKDSEAATRTLNIGKIQDVALRRLGSYTNELLQPYFEWSLGEESAAYKKLGSEPLKDSLIEFVATHICKNPSMSGVHEAFERLEALSAWHKEEEKSREEEEEEPEPPSRWASFPKETREVIEEIENNASKYRYEVQLLDQIVFHDDLDQGWSNIMLEDDVKRAITQIVDLSNADTSTQTGILRQSRINGALLYGPPGTGKTHLARVLAREYGSVMINISSAEIENKWVGETEKLIKGLFNLATKLAPSIIFIDEADAMFCKRSDRDTSWRRSELNMFLSLTDGLVKAKRPPFLLLSTNHPADLDEAVLRRVPARLYIGLPGERVREGIVGILLREETLEPGLELADVASQTPGFSGSDLKTLCVQAALIGQAEAEEEKAPGRVLKLSHFKAALRRCGSTVSAEAMGSIQRFAEKFDPNAVVKLQRAGPAKRGVAAKKRDWPSPKVDAVQTEHNPPEHIPPAVKSDENGSQAPSKGSAPADETDIDSLQKWRESSLYPYMTEEVIKKLQANGLGDRVFWEHRTWT